MARFTTLDPVASYDIIDADTGNHTTQGIQGVDAMNTEWDEGAEAWPAGTTDFSGAAVEIAETAE